MVVVTEENGRALVGRSSGGKGRGLVVVPQGSGRDLFVSILFTWAYLPYLEVLKSGHRTADLGSLNHTFFCGLNLPTLTV